MIRIALLFSSVLFISACGTLRPVEDTAKRSTLVLPTIESDETLYPAPVFTVSVPSYLNESTIWYSDSDGALSQIDGYVWASSLSKAILRQLTIGLAREKPYPPNTRLEVHFGRFILLDDGSGLSVAEVLMISPSSSTVLPIVKILPKDIWTPSDQSTYLQGYRTLLNDTIAQISQEITSLPSSTPQASPAKGSSE